MTRFIRMPEVILKTGVSNKSTVYAWIAKGAFPKPRKLSSRFAAWPEAEVDEWLASRKCAA